MMTDDKIIDDMEEIQDSEMKRYLEERKKQKGERIIDPRIKAFVAGMNERIYFH